jgi:hypothetical protein
MSTTEHTKTCSSNGLACKLSGPELQKRKATVITLLKSKVQEKHELENGYAYSFIGTDDLLTELVEFVKTDHYGVNTFFFFVIYEMLPVPRGFTFSPGVMALMLKKTNFV